MLVRDVTKAYETYDVTGATRPIEAFVEKLSTWYLRRSRRRFWKSGSDADKQAAYGTLYTALVTLSKLLAPAMPFLADELYQNLVCSVDPVRASNPSTWRTGPSSTKRSIDESLNRDMALVIKLVSLGHAARQKANRKVRQPLAGGRLLARQCVRAPCRGDLCRPDRRRIECQESAPAGYQHGSRLAFRQAAAQAVGQKYGNKFPALQKALVAMDAEEVAQAFLSAGSVKVTAGGEPYDILPDEVEVRAQAKEGFAVAEEGAYVAALVTELTPELVQEGQAREFVRRVQDLRKTANLEVADRIDLSIQASHTLQAAIETHRDYIMTETLAVSLAFQELPAGAPSAQDEFDGEKFSVALQKA